MKTTITAAMAVLTASAGLLTTAAPATAQPASGPGASEVRLIQAQWRGDRGGRRGGGDWSRGGRSWDNDRHRGGRRWRHRDNDGDVAAAAVVAGVLGLAIGAAVANNDDDRRYGYDRYGRHQQPAPYATYEEQQQDACRRQYGADWDPAQGSCAYGQGDGWVEPGYDEPEYYDDGY